MTSYRFSGFEADLESGELRRNGCRVPLQPQPFLILTRLLQAPGELVTREILIQAVWGNTYLSDPGHSLNIAVRKLRTALEDSSDEPRYIETVARCGYRFVGEVERVEITANPPGETATPPIPPFWHYRHRSPFALLALAILSLSAWMWLPLRGRSHSIEHSGAQTRLVWDNAVDLGGQVSGDGRYFSYTDWMSEDLGLGVRDLLARKNLKLTHMGNWAETKAEVGPSAVSPDGKWVAFSHTTYADKENEELARLVVIGMDGSNQRVLLEGDGLDYVHPYSWSQDGKWIAASVVYRGQKPGGRDSIALVSVDGQVCHLPVKNDLWANNLTFSPDGRYLAYSIGARKAQPVLMIRSREPESSENVVQDNAMMMGWSPDGSAILFSRERETTHDLYLLAVAGGKPAGNPVPIYASSDIGQRTAGVTKDGSLFYSTFNRRSETVVVRLSGSEIRQETPIANIPGTVSIGWLLGSGPAHFSPDGKRIVVLTPNDALTIHELESRGQRTITPDLKAWKAVRWAPDQSGLLLLGSATNGRSGVFRVDDMTGKTRLLASLPPDTWSFTPSNDGRTIYYGTPFKTQARNISSGTDQVLFESPKGGSYDLRVSHDGSRLAIRGGAYLAVVDLKSGRQRVLFRRTEPDPVALWAMDWSADDSSLLTIVRPGVGMERMQLWTFSADGGSPKRQPLAPELRGLSISPDGKYVATTRLTQHWQLWALDNFLPPMP
ncbi:MAG: PD40 domain-containing protein [Acidobacteria bacterium]|nr:PD40 domain-containing protein [Acidobacteriota bacterium]